MTSKENKILHVSTGWERMCGWDEGEVEGKTCSILQGEGTCWPTVSAMSSALSEGQDVRCQLINYRKCGSPFWNVLSIHPVRGGAGGTGDILLYIGFLRDYSYHMTRLVSVQPRQFVLKNACACVTRDTSLEDCDDDSVDMDEDMGEEEEEEESKVGERSSSSSLSWSSGDGRGSQNSSALASAGAGAGATGAAAADNHEMRLENPEDLPSPSHNCCSAFDGLTGGMAPTSQLFSKAVTLTPEYLALRAQDFLLSRGLDVYVADSSGHIAPAAAGKMPEHARYSLTAVAKSNGSQGVAGGEHGRSDGAGEETGSGNGSASDTDASCGGNSGSGGVADAVLVINVNIVPREEGFHSIGLRRLRGSAAHFYDLVEQFKAYSADIWDDRY